MIYLSLTCIFCNLYHITFIDLFSWPFEDYFNQNQHTWWPYGKYSIKMKNKHKCPGDQTNINKAKSRSNNNVWYACNHSEKDIFIIYVCSKIWSYWIQTKKWFLLKTAVSLFIPGFGGVLKCWCCFSLYIIYDVNEAYIFPSEIQTRLWEKSDMFMVMWRNRTCLWNWTRLWDRTRLWVLHI